MLKNLTAIRAIITGGVGILTAAGLIPSAVSEIVADNATQVAGGILVLWSVFTGQRAREQAQAVK